MYATSWFPGQHKLIQFREGIAGISERQNEGDLFLLPVETSMETENSVRFPEFSSFGESN